MGKRYAKLIVNSIEYNGDDKMHVMEETENLHLDTCEFIDEKSGTQYTSIYGTHKYNNGRITYKVAFEDQSLELRPGTVLLVEVQKWRKDIPNSDVVELEYELNEVSMPEPDERGDLYQEIEDGYKLVANVSGEVTLSFPQTIERKNEKIIYKNADPDMVKILFKDMLRCVSEDDCYYGGWCDDKSRGIVFRFKDGTHLEYGSVYCHGDTDTQKIIDIFLKYVESLDIIKTEELPHEENKEIVFFGKMDTYTSEDV